MSADPRQVEQQDLRRLQIEPISSRSPEQIRAALDVNACPWCESTWRNAGLHIARRHGISARDLKDYAGLPQRFATTTAEVSSALREHSISNAAVERITPLMRAQGRETAKAMPTRRLKESLHHPWLRREEADLRRQNDLLEVLLPFVGVRLSLDAVDAVLSMMAANGYLTNNYQPDRSA